MLRSRITASGRLDFSTSSAARLGRAASGGCVARGSGVVLGVRDGWLLVTPPRPSAALVRYAPGVRARLVEAPVGRSEDCAFVLV